MEARNNELLRVNENYAATIRHLESCLVNAETSLQNAHRRNEAQAITIGDFEARLASADSKYYEAQQQLEYYIYTLHEFETGYDCTDGTAVFENVNQTQNVPNSPLEQLLERYGLTQLARHVKVRRAMLEKRHK
jgi:hypothetical protein